MKSQEGSKPAERLNGSEILVRALAEEGVEYVFGYPGGSVLNIFDAIYKQDKFKHILVRHEQGAAHAADAYSRASNKVGVALVTDPALLTLLPASRPPMPTAFRWLFLPVRLIPSRSVRMLSKKWISSVSLVLVSNTISW